MNIQQHGFMLIFISGQGQMQLECKTLHGPKYYHDKEAGKSSRAARE